MAGALVTVTYPWRQLSGLLGCSPRQVEIHSLGYRVKSDSTRTMRSELAK